MPVLSDQHALPVQTRPHGRPNRSPVMYPNQVWGWIPVGFACPTSIPFPLLIAPQFSFVCAYVHACMHGDFSGHIFPNHMCKGRLGDTPEVFTIVIIITSICIFPCIHSMNNRSVPRGLEDRQVLGPQCKAGPQRKKTNGHPKTAVPKQQTE